MKFRVLAISAMATLAIMSLAWTARARSDAYTSGFYTRGSDAAFYLDQGGTVIDPFYVPVQEWSLLPRLTMTATREDNIFLSSTDEEAATTISAVPGLLLIYGRPENNHLYADAGMNIPVYDSSDELSDEPSYMLTLGGVYKTGKSQVFGSAGYRRLEDLDTLVGARIVKEDYIGSLGLEHRISAKSGLGLNGNVEFHEFDEASYTDYQRYYGAGRFYHRVTPMSQGFVQAGFGRDDLDKTSYGDADFYDLSIGLRGKQSPKTSIEGRVGYMWRQFDEDSIEDVDHWIASIGADTSLGLTMLTADLAADIRPAINAAGSTTVDQRLSVGANRRLFTDRLRGNANVFYGMVDYYGTSGRPSGNNVTAGDLVYDGREDDYWGFSLGLDWWTRYDVSIGINYSYYENRGARNSSDEVEELTSYNSGIWTLRASWNY